MKRLLLIICLICFFVISKGQTMPLDKETGKIIYTEVISMDSINKDELFNRAKNCFVTVFKNSSNVIQNENKIDGIITGKGVIKAYARALGSDYDGGYINFTITIACKDGRYKYIITNFIHEGNGSKMPSGGNLENETVPTWTNRQWSIMKSQTNNNVKELIVQIKNMMLQKSIQTDNW